MAADEADLTSGRTYGAICNDYGEHFEVNEGSGMVVIPLHCQRCGKEWWWELGPDSPIDTEPEPPPCVCGGSFTMSSAPRCPNCRSKDLMRDADVYEILYD